MPRLNHSFLLASFATLALAVTPALAGHYGGTPKGYYGQGVPHHGLKHKHACRNVMKHHPRHSKWYPRKGMKYRQYPPMYGYTMPMHSPYAQGTPAASQAPSSQPGGYGTAGGYYAAAMPSPSVTEAAAPAAKSIVETALASDGFSTLVAAVKAADLVDTLGSEGPLTVFAPTDEAFGQLPEGTVQGLLGNVAELKSVLTYHVVAGRISAADLLEQGEVETLNGATLRLEQLAVAKADIEASNGIIHVIDKVLLPPQP